MTIEANKKLVLRKGIRESNPLGRPLVLIITKSSVVRDERHTSLDSTELSESRRKISGT